MKWDRFEWMNAWVDDPEVNDQLMAVLIVMMRHMDRDGVCYPTRAQISQKIGRSVRTVDRRLGVIRKLGYLTNPADQMSSSRNRASLPARTPDSTVAPEQMHPVSSDGDPRQHCRPPLSALSPKQTNKQTNKQTRVEAAAASHPREAVAEFHDGDPPAQRILELVQSIGMTLSTFQAEDVWSTVMRFAESEESIAWQYTRWKLAQLEDEKYPARTLHGILTNRDDFDEWQQRQSELSVGRHDPEPTPPNAKTEPAPGIDDLRREHQIFKSWWSALTDDARAAVDDEAITDGCRRMMRSMSAGAAEEHRMGRRERWWRANGKPRLSPQGAA